jgi:NAD-dependent dihydropyrimidine dehydrogenase PreA subunit
MTYVSAERCVDLKDKAHIEECPVDCIYEGARMLYIHPDKCGIPGSLDSPGVDAVLRGL